MKSINLLISVILGILILALWYSQNHGLPLGFDHGAYKHFTLLLENNTNTELIPSYLKYQFEPFSGTFFYVLSSYIGKEYLYSWGYLAVDIFICLSLFILGKNNKSYTLGSYIGGFLFFFSTIQFMNLWWSFGKQIFATFFLIILLKYYRKIPIAILLMTACFSLHRLTGCVALLYIFIRYCMEIKNNARLIWAFLISIIIALGTYISFFYEQIFSHIYSIFLALNTQIFFNGVYGTGFRPLEFWLRMIPYSALLIVGVLSKHQRKKGLKFEVTAEVIVVIILTFLVSMRFIAHTRLGSFLELSIIILIAKNLYYFLKKKWIYIVLLVQLFIWSVFVNMWHTPFIDKTEHKILQNLVRDMPKDVTLVTLSGAYMSWLTEYSEGEIYSLYQGVSGTVWSEKEKYLMRYSPEILCENLKKLSGNIVIYSGVNESFPSLINNNCLRKKVTWKNGSTLMLYRR